MNALNSESNSTISRDEVAHGSTTVVATSGHLGHFIVRSDRFCIGYSVLSHLQWFLFCPETTPRPEDPIISTLKI